MIQRVAPLFRRSAAALVACAVLASCEMFPAPVEPVLKPQARPTRVAVARPAPVVAKPTSQQSAQLRSYLNQVQGAQLSQGLLRQDSGTTDAPFTADMLARNFEQIAFYSEYDGNFRASGSKSPLRRFEAPVRMELIFGAGVPPSQRTTDGNSIRTYAARLARVTGHPISVGGKPNFAVIVAGEDDRAEALAQAAARVPGISAQSLAALRVMRNDTYCVVAAVAGGSDPNVYTAVVAVIRAENPALLRMACIHEELAQGLGLANDSPAARPSIFNDDDEFALLTKHDELLLQMLYDARLRPGMSAEEAEPITRIIARELTGGEL